MRHSLTLISMIVLFSFFMEAVDFHTDEKLLLFRDYRSIGISGGPVYQNDDVLLNITLSANMEFNYWGLAASLPLNFLLHDKNDDTKTVGGVFPRDDWNSVRDFVSIIDYVHYGNPADSYYFYFGKLENYYMGNGTLMGAYFNTLRFRFPKRGTNIHFKNHLGGVEFVTGDMMPPDITGGRLHLKPWAFFDRDDYLNNFELGFTFLSDLRAPVKLSVSDDNSLSLKRAADNVFGMDVNFKLLSTLYYKLKVYSDFNKIAFAGHGIHTGVDHILNIPALINMKIRSRMEYRTGSSNYTPTYFNTFYDIQKQFYRKLQDGGLQASKYEFFSQIPDDKPWIHGYYVDFVLSFPEKAALGGSFAQHEEFQGYRGEKRLISEVNIFTDIIFIPRLTISFLFTKQNLEENRLFSFDNFTFMSAYAGFRFNRYSTFGLRLQTRWLHKTVSEQSTGVSTDDLSFSPLPEYYIGGSMSMSF